MFIIAKLVFESYVPNDLVPGLLFKQRIKDVIYGNVYEYDRIFMLNHIPQDRESYIITNGYPVLPKIMSLTANPDKHADILANNDQIGWWDDGPQSDELRDIELKDFNYILQEEDGYIEIEVQSATYTDSNGNEDEVVVPTIYLNKCTLRAPSDEPEYHEEDEEEEEYDDYGEDEYPYDHPKDKSDYDPQDFENE